MVSDEIRQQLIDYFDSISLARGTAVSYEQLADDIINIFEDRCKMVNEDILKDCRLTKMSPEEYAQVLGNIADLEKVKLWLQSQKQTLNWTIKEQPAHHISDYIDDIHKAAIRVVDVLTATLPNLMMCQAVLILALNSLEIILNDKDNKK